MKEISCLFLLLLFFACKKDKIDEKREGGLIKKIVSSETNGFNNFDYVFAYDVNGRIYSINDTVYNYGADGKIHSSRYEEINQRGEYKYEKDIQKSYKWDSKGRILEIKVEKWLEKIISPDGYMENNPMPYIEAHFYYTDNNSLPDSIGYGKTNGKLTTFKVFSHENGNILKEESISEGYYVSNNQPIDKRYVADRTVYSYEKEVNHHLYPLYVKMGFLPKGLGYVTSKHSPKSSTAEEFFIQNLPGDDSIITKVMGEQIDYFYTLTSNGFPNTIRQDVTVYMGYGSSAKGNPVFLNIYY